MDNKGLDLALLTREYLKSYYSINSYIGCTINCGYCFLAPLGIVPQKPAQPLDEATLIEQMVKDPYFVENKTVISLNNRTDPFLSEEVKHSTFRLLDVMEKKRLKNIVTMTTKCLIDEDDALRLSMYKNLRIVVIVTYNGIPFKIQPIPQKMQENTMINVSKYKNIKLLHQFRPIIPGVNDTKEVIKRIVHFSKKYCNATIYQGIRVNEYIKSRLETRNYIYEGKMDKHKQKEKSTDLIFDELRSSDVTYPIFEHTSCCLSFLYNEPDYNMHYLKMDCPLVCGNYKSCHESPIIIPENLEKELKRIGIDSNWEFNDNALVIKGPLNDEQKSYIKHILHLPVKSEIRTMTYSERIIN